MKLPRASHPIRSERENNLICFSKHMGGVSKAIKMSNDTYKYIDLYNSDEINSIQEALIRELTVYDDAVLEINVPFVSSGKIVIREFGNFITNDSYTNTGDITLGRNGKLTINSEFINIGTITLLSGSSLVIKGSLVNKGSLITEMGSSICFLEGDIILFENCMYSFNGLFLGEDGESLSSLENRIFLSTKLYVYLEGSVTIELLQRLQCELDETSDTIEGFTKVVINSLPISVETSYEQILEGISIEGYELTEPYTQETLSLSNPNYSFIAGRFSKKLFTVTVYELISSDFSSGPNNGNIVETSFPIKFFNEILPTDFTIKTYNGYTLNSIKEGNADSTSISSLYSSIIYSPTNYYIMYSLNTYTVTYILNGMSGASSASYTTLSGLVLQTPVSDSGGYFDGWYLDSSFSNRKIAIYAGEFGDVILYGKHIN